MGRQNQKASEIRISRNEVKETAKGEERREVEQNQHKAKPNWTRTINQTANKAKRKRHPEPVMPTAYRMTSRENWECLREKSKQKKIRKMRNNTQQNNKPMEKSIGKRSENNKKGTRTDLQGNNILR